MSDIAMSVSNVSKCYRVFDDQRSRLLHAVWPAYTKGMQEVWALKDINFEIKRGESAAIIGRNGGGKSTLLEILTGTLTPTTGSVKVNGRVSALLELGSGFNPEYSGRSNVVLNGLLLGLSKDDILSRFDEIEAFAEIGAAIDRPVKTYSSGMMMRLAFAVQVALEPDILIVDEALSVGDYFFQQKCFSRLRKMRDEGLTLLFVSHDMGTVRDLCSTAIYLKHGHSHYIGDSKAAVRAYLAEQSPAKAATPASSDLTAAALDPADQLELAEIKKTAIWSVTDDRETGRRLLAIRLLGADGQPTTHARIGDTVTIQAYFRTPPEESGHISLVIKNRFDQIVTNVGTYRMAMAGCASDDGSLRLEMEVDLLLEAGHYSMMVSYGFPVSTNRIERIDETAWFGPLEVTWDYDKERAPFLGMFGLPCRAEVILNKKPL